MRAAKPVRQLWSAAGSRVAGGRWTSSGGGIVAGPALQAIAAVVVGGTSILGGSGGYGGTVAGAITIVLLDNVLQIIGIERAGQNILYGLIILFMLFVYGRGRKIRE